MASHSPLVALAQAGAHRPGFRYGDGIASMCAAVCGRRADMAATRQPIASRWIPVFTGMTEPAATQGEKKPPPWAGVFTVPMYRDG